MTNNEIIEKMKKRVETVVREKSKQDFNESKPSDRKAVAKTIISEQRQFSKYPLLQAREKE